MPTDQPHPKVHIHIPTRAELAQRDITAFFRALAGSTDRTPEAHAVTHFTDRLLNFHPAITDRAAVWRLVRDAYTVSREIWAAYHPEAD